MSFAMKVAGDAGRGPVEITPGYQPNPLTEEEFDNFYGGKAIICNARQYDVNVARVSRLAPRDTAAFLGRGTSPDRPWTLFAPGYIFPYAGGIADELLGNQPFATRTLSGNDRQYDLWTVQALTGSLPASVDLDDDEVARLAKAARDAFRIDPLK